MTDRESAIARTPTTSQTALLERLGTLARSLGGALRPGRDMPVVEVVRERWLDLARALREPSPHPFDVCVCLTATDESPAEPRFRVVAHARSSATNERVRLVTTAPGDDPRVPSVVSVWPGANWMEREVFDLFGVGFDGHPDLRRILLPEGYGHHPLLKDFPIEGIEPDRLYREWERNRATQPSPPSR
jgi:NADH-quinone oxidoreductase subunit C